jgi:hypothetical protein
MLTNTEFDLLFAAHDIRIAQIDELGWMHPQRKKDSQRPSFTSLLTAFAQYVWPRKPMPKAA